MRALENYWEYIEKSRFLLISESGEDPRVIHRLEPESGCLFVSRVLRRSPERSLLYGSIPFTRGWEGRPLRGVLVCDLRLSPGSAIWCAPVSMARFAAGEPLIFAVPDRKAYPTFEGLVPSSPEELRETAAAFAESHMEEASPDVEIGGREQAESLLEKGLLAYKLHRHFQYQR